MRMQAAIFAAVALMMAGLPFFSLTQGPPRADSQGEEEDKPDRQEEAGETGGSPTVFSIQDQETGEVMEVTALDFITGAIGAEMPPTFHMEALKAQGLAAYTYALACKLQNPQGELGADFVADPSSFLGYVTKEEMEEMYGDQFEEYYGKIRQAAQAVEGQVIVYQEEPIVAAWHAISSGATEDAANVWSGGTAYLAPVDSSFDQLAPEYSTEVTFTSQEVEERVARAYPQVTLPQEKEEWFSILSRTPSGNVQEILVGDHLLTGVQVRALFDLRSANFGVAYTQEEFHFDVAGYGHDVGMSQYGADYLARQGMTYEEIIQYYYTGVEIVPEEELDR